MDYLDQGVARLRTHRNNIDRYRRLLKTKLSEVERQYLEARLFEEQSALDTLRKSLPDVTHQVQRAQRVRSW